MFFVHFENLGCRLNQTETEALTDDFLKSGFLLYDKFCDPKDVALVFINTCTVTSKAEQKCRRIIRSCVNHFTNALILVTGCYAQMEKAKIESIDRSVKIFPSIQKGFLSRFPEYYYSKLSENKEKYTNRPLDFSKSIFESFYENFLCKENNFVMDALNLKNFNPKVTIPKSKAPEKLKPSYAFELNTDNFTFHSRASLKIQDGCNCACTFCRIHLARGKSVSIEPEKALSFAKAIEDAGKNEIVLTGVNLSQYNYAGFNFPKLLQYLLDGTKRIKFRISSFYPEAITDEFLQVAKNKRVCPYFHLSVQSGSERILTLMNRPNNVENIYIACKNLRSIKPHVFLGADIITGFPSESDEDFEKTFNLCKTVGFEHIHSFPFSPRPGTAAYNLKPKIPEYIARKRQLILKKLSDENYKNFLESVQGEVFTGIVENSKNGFNVLTENYLLLPLKLKKIADNIKSGIMVDVKIEDGFCEII